jgi:hypothetical protein
MDVPFSYGVCPSAQLVGKPLRRVQAFDSFNVVQPTFIDAAFVRRNFLITSLLQNKIAARKNKEPRTMPGLQGCASSCCY